MDNVRKETHAVSDMTDQLLATKAVVGDEKDGRPLPDSRETSLFSGTSLSGTLVFDQLSVHVSLVMS